jgi:hypothetical protein
MGNCIPTTIPEHNLSNTRISSRYEYLIKNKGFRDCYFSQRVLMLYGYDPEEFTEENLRNVGFSDILIRQIMNSEVQTTSSHNNKPSTSIRAITKNSDEQDRQDFIKEMYEAGILTHEEYIFHILPTPPGSKSVKEPSKTLNQQADIIARALIESEKRKKEEVERQKISAKRIQWQKANQTGNVDKASKLFDELFPSVPTNDPVIRRNN